MNDIYEKSKYYEKLAIISGVLGVISFIVILFTASVFGLIVKCVIAGFMFSAFFSFFLYLNKTNEYYDIYKKMLKNSVGSNEEEYF